MFISLKDGLILTADENSPFKGTEEKMQIKKKKLAKPR